MRFIVVVLDSVGVGEMPDAAVYGDEGSNTLGNTAKAVGGLDLPFLGSLGIGNLIRIDGVPPVEPQCCKGSYGKMAIRSPGKDTITGHWELAGIQLERPFRTYPDGFPEEIVKGFERSIGRKVIGNIAASGTEIIKRLGEEHIRTGRPIVYTSADSVFQIAAHEEVIPVEELYWMCEVARGLLVGEYSVARVIARPFVGKPGQFVRTERRRDFSVEPPSPTILDALCGEGIEVVAVGKIGDIFGSRGITRSEHTKDFREGARAIERSLGSVKRGLIFANFVEFDMAYGHRNDPRGYARALEDVDGLLRGLSQRIVENDVLLICADHGCDPTTPSTDHSREYVPLLVTGPLVRTGIDLGTRGTLADVAATIADAFSVRFDCPGSSFYARVRGSKG